MAGRLVRLTVRATLSVAVAAVVLFAAFLAWRIPNEREENRAFETEVRRDDGPHVTWVDDRTVRVADVRFNPVRQAYSVHEQTLACEEAGPVAAAIDPNARIDCGPLPAVADPPIGQVPVVAAISDIHGHYHHLVALLQRAGVINNRLDWSFGANHLVVDGDIVDKGPEITRSLWLVKKLEQQAAGAGGHVHYLLGNHEYLALTGASAIRDRKYAELTAATGIPYAQLFSPATEFGRWIPRHGVAVRVNDTVFVHGGFSASVIERGLSLDDLNRIARESLADRAAGRAGPSDAAQSSLIWGAGGVTSFRGYFDMSLPIGFLRAAFVGLRGNPAAAELVTKVLDRYQVKRLVVGHTETRRIVALFGGRLVAICQRMSATDKVDEAEATELLMLEGDHAFRVALNGARRPL